MSDLESVDLSQESESEASVGMPPSPRAKLPTPASNPARNAHTQPRSQRPSQREAGTKIKPMAGQNGTLAPEKIPEELTAAKTPAAKPVAASRLASQASKKASEKPAEKAVEKFSEAVDETPKAPPPKPKRGRPKKAVVRRRLEVSASTEPPDASKPAAKPMAAPRQTATKPANTSKPTNTPKSAGKPATTAKPSAKPATTSKQAAKPADGETPRTTGRGRRRRLALKPVEIIQENDKHDKAPDSGMSSSQQPPVAEKEAPPQKQAAKPTERRLYGAAKAAVEKRKREEDDGRVSILPVSKSSRSKKKDAAGATPEVSEVPASPSQKGRPQKRQKRQHPLNKQQQQRDVTRPVTYEVIRIEDDEPSPEDGAGVTLAKDIAAKQSEEKSGPSQENANSTVPPAGNAALLRGRQSLPSSFARPAGRRNKTRDTASKAPTHRQIDDMAQDLPRTEDEVPLSDKIPDSRTQTRNEVPPREPRLRRARAARHSTGNIGAMDVDVVAEPDTNEHAQGISNSEAVKSMLDEIQRNAIPFLLTQDRICDSFSARIGEDVDVMLKNSDNDVFQVFSDRVKDALVADRLRLAVASAKADLRRGIEKHLREFARKVGAPLAEGDSSLLLRNEAFRSHSRVKEERRASKLFAAASPKMSNPFTPGRVAEDSNHLEDASDRDDLSDAPDPFITTPRQPFLKSDVRSIANVAELKKFVGYSYENLKLGCYRSNAILKLCAQPGGMTISKLHDITPLGRQMIRNKLKDLMDRGYVVEDVIREDDKKVPVYSTAAHVSDS